MLNKSINKLANHECIPNGGRCNGGKMSEELSEIKTFDSSELIVEKLE